MAEVNNIITDPNKDATDAFVQTKSEVSGVGGSSPISAAMKLKMIQDDPAFGYPKVRTIDEQAKNYYTKIMNDDELRDASMKATSNANDVSGTYTRVSNALKLAVYDRVNRPDMLEMSRGYVKMVASKPGEEGFEVGKALVQEAKKSLDNKLDDLVLETRPGDMNLKWYQKMPESLVGGAASVGEMVAIGAIPVVGVPAATGLMTSDVYSQGVQADIDAYIKKTGDTELKNFQPQSKDAIINGISAIAQGALEMSSFGAAGLVGRVAGKAGNAAVKIGAKETLSGFAQETTQALTGNLAEVAKGNDNWKDFNAKLGDVLSQGITGAILQGSMGYGIAHATRNKAITQTTEFFGKVNTQENLGKTDAEVKEQAIQFVDEQLDNGMRATTQELIDRSGLNQDRGDLRDKVVSTLKQAYMDSEEFKDMSEEKQAQVIESAATIESANMIYDAVEKGIPVSETPYKKMKSTEAGIFLFGTQDFDADTQAKIDSINKGIREIKDELAQAKLENDLDKIDNMERRLGVAKKDALVELSKFAEQQTANNLLASRIADMAEKVKAQRESRETKQQTAEAKVRKKTDRNTFRNLLRKIEVSKNTGIDYQTDIKADINSKENQLKIIQKTNPAPNDNLTWIRSIDDIKTFSEAMQDSESFAYPDFTEKDAEKALLSGYIKVYSSNDIKNGNFVSPSKMQAQDYAGNKSVKESILPITDIAWINADEGQVAKNTILSADINSPEFKKWFGDSKVVDKDGNALPILRANVYIQDGNGPTGISSFDFRDGHSAPGTEDLSLQRVIDGYLESENGETALPDDYFTEQGKRIYAYDKNGKESYSNVLNTIKNKSETITAYRAIPTDINASILQNGDWITFSKGYAKQHGESRFGGDYKIIEQEIPVSEVWFDGNDINEWGYDNGQEQTPDVYVSIQNPEYADKIPQSFREIITLRDEKHKDGVITPDGKYFVIDRNQIKSVNNEGTFSKETGNIYKQSNTTGKKADNYRGAYLDKYELVQLGNLADETSFGHEMAHHWANNNFKWLRDGNPSESFKAMWGAVESWLGVRPEQTKLSSAQSEKFARGYESWIISRKIANVGDADKKELEKAFDNFTDWSLDIYDSVESQYFDQVGKIPESVSGWFNKIQEGFTPTKLEQAGIINKETADVLKVQDNAAQVIDTGVKEYQKSVESSDKTAEKATETESAIPSVDNLLPVPEKSEEFNTGKEKQSESAKNFEKRTGIEQESKYNQRELDKARESARALIDKDENLAWSILQGEKPEQGGIFKQDLLVAMEEKLKEDNDIDGLIKLAPLVKEIGMESGQKLSALKGRTEFAFTDAINLIDKMAETGKAKKEIESQVKEYQKEIDEVAFNWAESKDEDFFNTMECQ